MADLRVRWVLLVCLAACGKAGAQPNQVSGVTPPAGWTVVPSVASAAREALGKVAIDGVEAWGEPAMGCYAVWMAMQSSGRAEDVAEQILASLTPAAGSAAPPAIALRDVVKPTGEDGVLSLAFDRAPYAGRLRVRLGGGRLDALACFSSRREPAACETACTGLLGGTP